VAKKSKADAVASGKNGKVKTTAKATPAKAKKPVRPKKVAIAKVETKTAPASPPAVNPGLDQIELRAYFISERRRRFDLPGDANSDWLEAKRQLLAETPH